MKQGEKTNLFSDVILPFLLLTIGAAIAAFALEEFLVPFTILAGGIVGVSLYPPHVAGDRATLGDVVRHFAHYISLGGENALVLGCDFDGIETTPEGLSDVGDLPRLYDALAECFGEATAKRIFFENANRFISKNLK